MDDNTQLCAVVNRIAVENVEQLLIQQYNHDFPERNCDDKSEMSQEDHHFMDSVSRSACFMDGHYYIDLPMKKTNVQMPNNRSSAIQRLLNLKSKLKRNPAFHEEYTSFMNDMLNKGYAVAVPTTHLNHQDGKVWYIPHHKGIPPTKEEAACGV